MNEQEFQTGCTGICTLSAGCYQLGKWLEDNFIPEDCTIFESEGKAGKQCNVDISNKVVADIVYPRVKEISDYYPVMHACQIGIKCTRKLITDDVPVPPEEIEYWEERVKKLEKEIKDFYLSITHHHKIQEIPFTEHLHIDYQDPTKEGVEKLGNLIMDIKSSKRPKIGGHLK